MSEMQLSEGESKIDLIVNEYLREDACTLNKRNDV